MTEIDLAENLRTMRTVEKVSDFPAGITAGAKLQGRFFICPRIMGKGYRVNRQSTGFTVKYDGEGKQRKSTFERIKRVKAFLREFKNLEIPIEWEIKEIVASAEALFLFSEPVKPVLVPREIEGFPAISTYELAEKEGLSRFWELRKNRPWFTLSSEVVKKGNIAAAGVLNHTHASQSLVDDFACRVFTEYALEGIWFSEGLFGEKPIILGVEGLEVPKLINAALSKSKKVAAIQLR